MGTTSLYSHISDSLLQVATVVSFDLDKLGDSCTFNFVPENIVLLFLTWEPWKEVAKP